MDDGDDPVGGTLPRLAFENLLVDPDVVAVTVDGELPERPKEFAFDWKPWRRWQSPNDGAQFLEVEFASPKAWDCFVVHGHNLGEAGGTIALQYHDGAGWVTWASAAPAERETIGSVGPEQSAARVRFLATSTPASSFAALFVGKALVPPVGLQPGFADPLLAERATLRHATSRGGLHLGTTVEFRDAKLRLQFADVDDAWAREHWRPFRRHAESLPFFLFWNSVEVPESAAFCSQAEFGDAAYSRPGFVNLSLSCKADLR